jgi:hypothetical protein
MILTSDFNTLTLKLNEWFNEAASLAVEAWIGQQLYDTGETNWQVYNGLILNGAAKFDRVAEGAQLPQGTIAEGDSASFTQRRYGGRLSVTKDMRMFDRYDQISEVVKDNAQYAFDRIDQSQADLILNGFSGTSYTDVFGLSQSNVTADGVVLFSASHTNNQNGTTARNLIRNAAGTANPGLSRDAIITARKDGRVNKDPNGANRPINLSRLIVSATNEDLAERTVYSAGVVGTPNVDLNPLKGKVSNILVWSRLDTRGNDGTDTSSYWFMADDQLVKKTLKSPFAQKPMMYAPSQVDDSKNWEYTIDAYYTLGLLYQFGIWGSTGAN